MEELMLKQTKIEDNELRQTLNAIINKYPNYEYKEDAPVEFYNVKTNKGTFYIGKQKASYQKDMHVSYLKYTIFNANDESLKNPPLIIRAYSSSPHETGYVFQSFPGLTYVDVYIKKKTLDRMKMYGSFADFSKENEATTLKIVLDKIIDFQKNFSKEKYDDEGYAIPFEGRYKMTQAYKQNKKTQKKLLNIIDNLLIAPEMKEKDAQTMQEYFDRKRRIARAHSLCAFATIKRAVENFIR